MKRPFRAYYCQIIYDNKTLQIIYNSFSKLMLETLNFYSFYHLICLLIVLIFFKWTKHTLLGNIPLCVRRPSRVPRRVHTIVKFRHKTLKILEDVADYVRTIILKWNCIYMLERCTINIFIEILIFISHILEFREREKYQRQS